MSSSIRPRFTIDIGGAPLQFASPFITSYMILAQDPAQFQMAVPSETAVTVWDGSPPFTTFDFLALLATRDGHVEFTVDGGQGDEYHFTIPLPASNFPLVIPGGSSYAGQTGTEDAFTEGTLKPITKIRYINLDTDNDGTITVFIAQAES